MGTIVKFFIEFVIILFLFFVLDFVWLRGMWDPSSSARDQTSTPWKVRSQSRNHQRSLALFSLVFTKPT